MLSTASPLGSLPGFHGFVSVSLSQPSIPRQHHSLQRADFLPKCYGAYAALNDAIVYLVNAIGGIGAQFFPNGRGFSYANGSWYSTAFAAPSCCVFPNRAWHGMAQFPRSSLSKNESSNRNSSWYA